MGFKKFDNRYILRLDKGEEITGTLEKFCKDNDIGLGSIHGIGAVNEATIGCFKASTKEYQSRKLTGDHEITALTGSVSTMNGDVYLHLHISLSDSSCDAFGGHLNSGVVSATCEVMIDVDDGEAGRDFSEEIGLNLFKF